MSTLIAWGEVEGYTAMAKTVGIPVAIAAQYILNGTPLSVLVFAVLHLWPWLGTIKTKGVVAPLLPEIFSPILKGLADERIVFMENSTYSYQ